MLGENGWHLPEPKTKGFLNTGQTSGILMSANDRENDLLVSLARLRAEVSRNFSGLVLR